MAMGSQELLLQPAEGGSGMERLRESQMIRTPSVSAKFGVALLALALMGCGGEPANDQPSIAVTSTGDLIAACRQAAVTEPRPQLTYDQALALSGKEITACRVAIPPAQGEPEVTTIPGAVTAEPQFAEGVAMDRPRPPGCDTVARSTVLFFVVDGSLVEARLCGTSEQS
ncbi:MAG: hypothetical protein U0904_08710 [Candidatus Nanopelagicales bacterium]|nr:hypothetical protein [Candidatus Nanopelagicales bacterium]